MKVVFISVTHVVYAAMVNSSMKFCYDSVNVLIVIVLHKSLLMKEFVSLPLFVPLGHNPKHH